MSRFDTVIVVDWSARSAPSPAKPSADAIWIAVARDSGVTSEYIRTRVAATARLRALLEAELQAGRRVLAGFDFPFGYPAGFAQAVTGTASALAVWEALSERIKDAADNANNRFEVAADLNRLFPGIGPFWGRPHALRVADVPEKGSARSDHGLPERRAAEQAVPRSQPCWKLYTTGSVGSQALMGLPHLQALRARFGADLAVWPFEAAEAPIVLAEIYPSLLDDIVQARMGEGDIKDDIQVRVLAEALFRMDEAGDLEAAMGAATGPALGEEGWILGVGAEAALRAAITGARPLRNDCFALPAGVHWTPVDEALALLNARLTPVTGVETCAVPDAAGRILAQDAVALRSNPPGANSAVDGYGFAHASLPDGPSCLPLVPGRAAAGAPFAGVVPGGHAVRILTGALIPAGVDTVVLEEDVRVSESDIRFDGTVKPGANTRRAGEDVAAGETALTAGRCLSAPDLALLSALGMAEVPVRKRLRVGVMSTGDELATPGATLDPGRTYDANRPMLLALAQGWGYGAVDLGQVADDRATLAKAFDSAAVQTDVILTSGGASAGDEDHVSALLRDAGAMETWRIAVKPGRPLALGLWQGVPVFGLPGNPVAAFVCALIFARPSLSRLAGGLWVTPAGFTVPAAFSKRKKAGRREYLRARLTSDGAAEVFRSEGSGRISGLSWAEGLVELGDAAQEITPGVMVRYYPYGSFGV